MGYNESESQHPNPDTALLYNLQGFQNCVVLEKKLNAVSSMKFYSRILLDMRAPIIQVR
jgi:hypothetical protein